MDSRCSNWYGSNGQVCFFPYDSLEVSSPCHWGKSVTQEPRCLLGFSVPSLRLNNQLLVTLVFLFQAPCLVHYAQEGLGAIVNFNTPLPISF